MDMDTLSVMRQKLVARKHRQEDALRQTESELFLVETMMRDQKTPIEAAAKKS